MNPKARISAIAAISFLNLLPAADAAPQTWVGLGTNGNWATPGNFTPGGALADGDMQFTGSNYLANTNDGAGLSIHSLSIAAGAGVFDLQGFPVRVVAGITNFSSNLQTLSFSQITYGVSQVWDAGAAGLRVNTDVVWLGGTGSLTITGAGNTVFEEAVGLSFNSMDRMTLIKQGTGTLTLNGADFFGYRGGTVLQGGVVSVREDGNLGNAVGALTFDGGTLRTTAGFTMNRATTINSNGGTFDVAAGTLTQQGDISGAGNLVKRGTGTLTLTGSNSYTGGTTVRNGTLAVNGGGSITHTNANLTVGFNSGDNATLRIATNTTVSNFAGSIGTLAGSTGLVEVNGGNWMNSSALYVGNEGNGTLKVRNGSVSNTDGYIGVDAGSTGLVEVSGGNWTNSSNLFVGSSGNGTLNLSNGNVSALSVRAGFFASGVGAINLRGGALETGDLSLGYRGTGSLLVNGGTMDASFVRIGELSNAVGNATVASGTLRSSGNIILGEGGNGTLNLVGTGTVSANAGAGTVTVAQNAGSTGTLNIGTNGAAGALTAAVVDGGAGTAVVNFNHTNNLTFSPRMTGGLQLNKLGSGTLTLTASNSHTGATDIGAGTLALSGNARINSSSSLNVGSGAVFDISGLTFPFALVNNLSGAGSVRMGARELQVSSSTNTTFSGAITGAGTFTKLGAATLNLTGSNSYTGGTTIYGGTLAVGAGGRIEHVGEDLAVENSTLAINGTGSVNSQLAAIDGPSGLVRLDGGTFAQAVLIVSDGQLEVNGGGAVTTRNFSIVGNSSSGLVRVLDGSWNVGSTIGLGNSGSGTLEIGTNGTVSAGSLLLADRTNSAGRLTLLGGSLTTGQIRKSEGNGSVVIAGGTLRLSASRTNLFEGFEAGDLVLSNGGGKIDTQAFDVGTAAGFHGGGGLTKQGAGTLSLGGSNSYSGPTVVEAGAVLVNGSLSGTNTVTVKSGAALGGTGSVAGAVTVENGGILAPGASAGTFSVGSLILNSTSALKFELGTASDLVVVAGSLTLDGILDVGALTGFGGGSYTLFQYGGSLTNNGLTLGTIPTGFSYAIDLSTTNYVKLKVVPDDLYWDGPNTTPNGTVNGGTGTWNNTLSNWTSVNGLANFAWTNQSTAHFAGTAGTVTVGENVSVAEMLFETSGYVLTGVGQLAIKGATLAIDTATNVVAEIGAAITGTGSLEKTGAGTLTLTASNSYTGGTLISAGTLQVGNGGTNGAITGNVTNNAALAFNRAGSLSFTNVISGSGSLTKLGTGTLTLTASNSYAGGTVLSGGALLVDDDSALGSGTLQLGGGTTFGVVSGGNVGLSNAVTLLGDVNIAADALSVLDFEGTVDLGAATRTVTFTEDSSSVCFASAINGTGGLNLVMAGSGLSGEVTFCGPDDNTYAGLTRVGDGVELGLEKDPGAIAIAGDLLIDVGGAVTLVDTSEQINPASTVTVNGIFGILSISGTTTQTIGNLQGTGSIINTLGPAVLNVNSGNFAGTILDGGADVLAVMKNGPGTLTLSGASAYQGGTIINEGVLRATSPTALGSGPVALGGGTLAPTGQLDVASFDWTGGVISSTLGAVTSLVNIAGDLRVAKGGGTFDFTSGAGFTPNTFYNILNAANLDDALMALISGNPLLGLNPVFTRLGTSLLVNFAGSSSGPILQNIGGPWTPTTANFRVSGPVITGAPADNNTVNSLRFDPSSQLQVFNNLTVTSGLFDVASGNAGLAGGNVVVPGDFAKTGAGTLEIGSNFLVQGAANLTGGQMTVNGQFNAPGGFNVFADALLGGSGLINGSVLNNGTVAPGNSPGTLTISGNYTQSATGSLQLEIASTSLFDRLVVGGTANLAGTLAVQDTGGALAYGQQYDFLQAAGITGAFDQITMPSPGRYRGRFLVNGGTGSLLIAPTSYTLVAVTRNQRSVAGALDAYIPATGGDRETVSIAFDRLTAEQYPAALDQIAPTFHESLASVAIEQAFAVIQMINQRLSSLRLGTSGFDSAGSESQPLVYDKGGQRTADPKDLKSVVVEEPDPRWSLWTQAHGMFAEASSANQVPSYGYDGGGVLLGVDYTFGDARFRPGKSALTTGVFGGYQGYYARYDGGGSTTANSALFGGYASFTKGGFYADSVVSGGYGNFKVLRPIDFSTINRTARSSQDSGQFNAAINLGHDWHAGKFTFGPIAGAQYSYAGIAPFTERGAESLNLRVDQQDANSLRSTLGGRVAYTWNVCRSVAIIPEARMFWVHEFLNNSRSIDAALDGGAGPSFNYLTSDPSRNSVFCGAGVTAQFGENLTASAYWNVDFGRPDYLGQAVSLDVGWKF
jgi:fibronectin-binding autotransporter adhesin